MLTIQVFGGWKYQIVERMQTCDQIKFRSQGPNIKCFSWELQAVHDSYILL